MKKYILLALVVGLLFSFVAVSYANTLYTDRLWGADRIDTAIEISKDIYGDGDLDNDNVIICRSDLYPDALAAAGLAGGFWGGDGVPILLNPSNSLDSRVEDELDRLFNDCDVDDTVWIIGGTGAISSSVEDDLDDLGCTVERIGGTDRYDTAAKVADEIQDQFGDPSDIFVCTGENWPDALCAAAYSYYSEPFPILLVRQDEIPGDTLDWMLSNNDVNAYVVGGTGVVGSDVMSDLGYYLDGDVHRVAGDNRYETCIELIEHGDLWDMPRSDAANNQQFAFATGLNFPDALAGSSFWLPIVLTSSLHADVEDYFDDLFGGAASFEYGFGTIFGGTGAVSKSTEDDIAEAVSDGDFDPTDTKPTIEDFTVTINPDNDIPDVAQYDQGDYLLFEVTTDKHIWNEDGEIGTVVIEDISEVGGNEAPYDEDDYELTNQTGDDTSDNDFWEDLEVKKKHTTPDQRSETFTARATNQAGSDTDTSSSVDIYN